MNRIVAAAVLGLAVGVWSNAAAEEQAPPTPPGALACADHADLVAALTERYDERRVSIGLQNNGHVLEIYASKDTGSWTALSTRTDGVACILAVGRHFEQQPVAGGRAADDVRS